jgi:hypothetical protein
MTKKERRMTTQTMATADKQSLGRLKLLVWLAVGAAVVAALAGVLLLLLDPASGSSTEATLGAAAAVSGLATGALAITAFVYAQAKNLWRFAPPAIRIVVWVFIAAGIALTLWNLISQPFST